MLQLERSVECLEIILNGSDRNEESTLDVIKLTFINWSRFLHVDPDTIEHLSLFCIVNTRGANFEEPTTEITVSKRGEGGHSGQRSLFTNRGYKPKPNCTINSQTVVEINTTLSMPYAILNQTFIFHRNLSWSYLLKLMWNLLVLKSNPSLYKYMLRRIYETI